jgi:hypothetical protein
MDSSLTIPKGRDDLGSTAARMTGTLALADGLNKDMQATTHVTKTVIGKVKVAVRDLLFTGLCQMDGKDHAPYAWLKEKIVDRVSRVEEKDVVAKTRRLAALSKSASEYLNCIAKHEQLLIGDALVLLTEDIEAYLLLTADSIETVGKLPPKIDNLLKAMNSELVGSVQVYCHKALEDLRPVDLQETEEQDRIFEIEDRRAVEADESADQDGALVNTRGYFMSAMRAVSNTSASFVRYTDQTARSTALTAKQTARAAPYNLGPEMIDLAGTAVRTSVMSTLKDRMNGMKRAIIAKGVDTAAKVGLQNLSSAIVEAGIVWGTTVAVSYAIDPAMNYLRPDLNPEERAQIRTSTVQFTKYSMLMLRVAYVSRTCSAWSRQEREERPARAVEVNCLVERAKLQVQQCREQMSESETARTIEEKLESFGLGGFIASVSARLEEMESDPDFLGD